MKKVVTLFIITLLFFFISNSVKANSIGFGIVKSIDHETPVLDKYSKELILNNNGYYIGDTSKKKLYLTFDCGYENGYTAAILDALKENNVKAIFFVTGHYVKTNNELIRRMDNEGHLIGNHTDSHPNLTTLTDEMIIKELNSLENLVFEVTNKKIPKFVRPPEGVFNEHYLALTSSLGYKNIFWSLAYVDWKKDEKKPLEYSYDNVMKYYHNGAIILMHTVSSCNALALSKIIKDLKSLGYEFDSIDKLVK